MSEMIGEIAEVQSYVSAKLEDIDTSTMQDTIKSLQKSKDSTTKTQDLLAEILMDDPEVLAVSVLQAFSQELANRIMKSGQVEIDI